MTKKTDTAPGRREGLSDFQLAPESLVGSWFVSEGRDDGVVGQGMVVGEPQAGCYLMEMIDPINAAASYQTLVTIPQLIDGEARWYFYDTQHDMVAAAAQHRLSAEH